MIKKYFWKILLAALAFTNIINAKPEIVEWKILSDRSTNRAQIFIDNNNKVFVEWGHYLWINNNLLDTTKYGNFVDGFVNNGRVHIVFRKDSQHIDMYTVDEDICHENRVILGDFSTWSFITKVIHVPGEKKDAYYLLGSRTQLPRNPGEFMSTVMSGGHGPSYDKPILAEIQGQNLLEYRKIPYGGKVDESYRIREVLTGKDKIYFLGFRQEYFGSHSKPSIPDILYYTDYDVKKGKAVRAADIYDRIRHYDLNDRLRGLYWHVSADNFNGNLSIIFSWNWTHGSPKSTEIRMEPINTPIYYSKSDGDSFSETEIIGQGILPLVRVDSVGNVNAIWANSNGKLVHKLNRNNKWNNEQLISDGIIDVEEVWEGMRQGMWWLQNMCAEFDKDDNLHVVFTSKGKLVLAKIKFD